MGRKNKYTFEEKVKACEDYLSGRKSAIKISRELKIGKYGAGIVRSWAKQYSSNGPTSLKPRTKNATYTKEFKFKVINDYQNGDSLNGLKIKYNIPSSSTILAWVNKYNRHEEIEDYSPHPEVYTMSTRKTTIEERIEIVNWCLEHDKNYKEAANKFNCSYTQVYQWVKKYIETGVDGLSDKRGKRKPEEILTDEEKLKREIAKLEKRNKELEIEVELLKKLNEFDWRG